MNHAGELAALTRLVRPHVAIVTAIAPAHTAFFSRRGGDRRRQGRDLRGAGARRHRDHPVRQPASRPADRRRRSRMPRASRPSARGEGADVRAREAVRAAAAARCVTARLRRRRELTFTHRAAGRALGVERAGGAGGGRGGGRRSRRRRAGAGRTWPGLPGAARGITVRGGRRRGAADRRKLQRQPRLDGGDARAARARSRRRAGSRCSARCASWATQSDALPCRAGRAAARGAASISHCSSARRWRRSPKRLRGGSISRMWPTPPRRATRCSSVIAPGDAVLVKGSNAVGLARVVEALAAGAAVRRTPACSI